jgi:hypothetical protein
MFLFLQGLWGQIGRVCLNIVVSQFTTAQGVNSLQHMHSSQ